MLQSLHSLQIFLFIEYCQPIVVGYLQYCLLKCAQSIIIGELFVIFLTDLPLVVTKCSNVFQPPHTLVPPVIIVLIVISFL